MTWASKWFQPILYLLLAGLNGEKACLWVFVEWYPTELHKEANRGHSVRGKARPEHKHPGHLAPQNSISEPDN